MEFRQLRYAVTLSGTLNFRRAAEAEHITQSAFSEQIARLEREVGARLFDRDSRSVSLTAAGELFVGRAERILAEMSETAQEARSMHAGERGSLTVGLFAEGLAELTPVLVSAIRAASPEMTLSFVELTIQTQASALLDGDVDVAIVRPPLDEARLRIHELFREPRLAAVGIGHPLACAETVSVGGLLEEPVVATVPRRWGAFWSCDDMRGRAGRAAATVTSVTESLASVAYLGAVDTLPASSSRYYRHPGVRYLPLTGAPFATAAVAQRRDDRRVAVEAFCRTAALVSARHLSLIPGALGVHESELAG